MTQKPNDLSAQSPAASRIILMALIGAGLGLLTMVIVVQGRTIETQRQLIRALFEDSTELNRLRNSTGAEKAPPPAPEVTPAPKEGTPPDRKSTRLNSSHRH